MGFVVLTDGPLFPSDHELALKIEGLDRPKRKRGRPPKPPPQSNEQKDELQTPFKKEEEEDELELDNDGRRRRRRKVPTRFQEVIQVSKIFNSSQL